MINVNQAQEQVLKNAFLSETEEILLRDASGRVLATDVFSPVHNPLFDQTAVDGYAIKYNDISGNDLPVIGEIKAGDEPDIKLEKGKAVRIFTGAPIPEGTDTIVKIGRAHV